MNNTKLYNKKVLSLLDEDFLSRYSTLNIGWEAISSFDIHYLFSTQSMNGEALYE